MGVTSSEFQQSVTYKRALEGELASTISAHGRRADRLRPPRHPGGDRLRRPRRPDPTASVFVETDARPTLSGDQVQAIVHLTSAAIEGLKPANVAVVDAAGQRALRRRRRRGRLRRPSRPRDYEQRTCRRRAGHARPRGRPRQRHRGRGRRHHGRIRRSRRAKPSPTPRAPCRSASPPRPRSTPGTGGGAAGVLGPDNIAVPGDTSGNGSFDSSDRDQEQRRQQGHRGPRDPGRAPSSGRPSRWPSTRPPPADSTSPR